MGAVREGVDFSFARPSPAALKAAGKSFVCRYLSPPDNGKNLSKAEADGYRALGIAIVSNWERYGDWTHDYSGGYSAGVAHAKAANSMHLACGGGPNDPIIFSTDYQPSAAQMPTIGEYYKGVASVIGLSRTGAYGGLSTIQYLFDHNLIKWGWQTYAWSGGRWDPRAQLQQYRNNVTVAGGSCDLDRAMTANFGQWGSNTVQASTTGTSTSTGSTTAGTAAQTYTHETEDTMGQFKKGFAFDEKGGLLDKSLVEIIPIDTGTGGTLVGYLSVACDQGSAKLRIAVRGEPNGSWAVPSPRVIDSSQGRQGIWATGKGTGGTVTLGRMKQSATDTDDSTPIGWTLRYV